MKHLLPFWLLFVLVANAFVSAEDRTSDPNDLQIQITDPDVDWQVNLANQDSLTNEDFNVDIKIEDSSNFADYHNTDDDLNDDDNDITHTPSAAGDFDYDLIRREIIGEAHKPKNIQSVQVEIDNDDDDDSTGSGSEPEVEKSVDSVDDDLRPDNGKIGTQVTTDPRDDEEVEDSDDGDDADIIDDNTDSNDDDVDYDYQDDDSAVAGDDYVNDPSVENDNVGDEVDYDGNDDSDDGDDMTDNFLSQDFIRYISLDAINLKIRKLNLTTTDMNAQSDDDTADGLDEIYYNADDDSDSYYDIYDSKYQEEPERGGFGSDDTNDSTYDYDIFIDIDDSAWDSYLTNDNNDDDDDAIADGVARN